MVEHHLAKVRVAGSNPVVRSRLVAMRRRFLACFALIIGVALGSSCANESSPDAVIAAASDTREAFGDIAEQVESSNGYEIEFVFGSSGLLREQLLNGAPYDLYVSANTAYVDEIVNAGAGVANSRAQYALGRLAVIVAEGATLPERLEDVASFDRVVIANPQHAPYGVAAREALTSAGVLPSLEARLILADNVADAVRLVESGEVSAGIVALSLVMDREHLVVAPESHEPIRQSYVVTVRGRDNALIAKFLEVLNSPFGRDVLERYGFASVSS